MGLRFLPWLVLPAVLDCGHANIGQIAATTAVAAAAAIAENAGSGTSEEGCSQCEYTPCDGRCDRGWSCVDDRCVPPPPDEACSPVPDAGSLLVVTCADGG